LLDRAAIVRLTHRALLGKEQGESRPSLCCGHFVVSICAQAFAVQLAPISWSSLPYTMTIL